ncbi:MAG: hypothetical protein UZ11_BCD004001579 [Bacteroidetes bacterium OLB11]|nr:MAG: hypothetical protein UZ11_BCD004001579 [Bacteroidetes bacterium OLB11]
MIKFEFETHKMLNYFNPNDTKFFFRISLKILNFKMSEFKIESTATALLAIESFSSEAV